MQLPPVKKNHIVEHIHELFSNWLDDIFVFWLVNFETHLETILSSPLVYVFAMQSRFQLIQCSHAANAQELRATWLGVQFVVCIRKLSDFASLVTDDIAAKLVFSNMIIANV